MKQGIFLVAILLTLPLVLAQNVYELEEFSKTPVQAIVLEEGDALKFNLLNGEHALLLKQISRNNDAIKLNVYPFKKTVTQVPLFTLDNVVKVDLNKDGINDLALDIFKIEEKRVTLIIKLLNDNALSSNINTNNDALDQPPEGQGLVVGSVKSSINYYRTFFVISLIIVALLAVLALKKNRSAKNNIDEEKPEE